MNTLNRVINTNHTVNNQMISLEFLKDSNYKGKSVKTGDVVECSRSEAKRLLTTNKDIKLHL